MHVNINRSKIKSVEKLHVDLSFDISFMLDLLPRGSKVLCTYISCNFEKCIHRCNCIYKVTKVRWNWVCLSSWCSCQNADWKANTAALATRLHSEKKLQAPATHIIHSNWEVRIVHYALQQCSSLKSCF